MSVPRRQQNGPSPPREPAPEITSHRQEVGIETEGSALDRQGEADDFAVLLQFPYGFDHPGADQWLDRDGMIHSGAGPYQHRPLRRLRRALARWFR